jgi:hypothetical protein
LKRPVDLGGGGSFASVSALGRTWQDSILCPRVRYCDVED